MTASRELDDAGVSTRESEVLTALGERLTNAEIGARLFISVRTVESHVSSLLRKLGVRDRRALAALAADRTPVDVPAGASPRASTGDSPGDPGTARTPVGAEDRLGAGDAVPLPSPLTSFVGRAAERAALAEAVGAHRFVTAVGPGGVGKTRLALAVAGDVAERYPGGVWYVDLVPVTDPTLVAGAVATAFGYVEQPGRSPAETLVARLRRRRALLVLDNCEHLVDGVAVLVEQLLAGCPDMAVLATSRTRLVLPFERTFPVPGLSTGGDDGDGDAVALFLERAAAVGAAPPGDRDRRRVAAVCRRLDGMALAIELAASRLPGMGLDGLEAGLADRLGVLTGGSRVDGRHRSLRATLDWSYDLADPVDRGVLRRVAAFAAPFTAGAAVDVAGFPPVAPAAVPAALARLVDQSLLVAAPGRDGTRYRMLETVRRYGDERRDGDEDTRARVRHLRWCLTTATGLDPASGTGGPVVDGAWHEAFDAVAGDLRAGLAWAASRPEHRSDAHALARTFAGLAYRRGRVAEAQQRYEEASGLAGDDVAVAADLHSAAVVAGGRQIGVDALRLHDAASDAARRAGDPAVAAGELALGATFVNRCSGTFTAAPEAEAARARLRRAHTLALGHPEVDPLLLVAEAFDTGPRDPLAAELAERATALARRAGDPLAESAALDQVTVTQLERGEVVAGAASARRRTELLAGLVDEPEASYEVPDALQMAADTSLGAGDLAAARGFAHRMLELPVYRQEVHLGLTRLVVVEALAGEWEAALEAGTRYRRGWDLAGQPPVGNLAGGASAMAMVAGLRGDDAARDEWAAIFRTLRGVVDRIGTGCNTAYAAVFDAVVRLHRGEPDAALDRLDDDPEQLRQWYTGLWRQWYAAAWAEASVLAGRSDASDRLARARVVAQPNPVALALVERAAALASGDRGGLLGAAAALEAAGCRYQWARTLALAGGPEAATGEAALSALGAMPMTTPAPAP